MGPPLPRGDAPRLTAVVVHYRTPRETVLALRSLASSRRRIDEVVVVDNGSGDGSAAAVRGAARAAHWVEAKRNLGFAGGTNFGIREALARGAELVLLVNSDALVAPECPGRLERALADDPAVGIAAPVVLDASDPGTIETRGIAFSPRSGRMLHPASGASYRLQAPPSDERVDAVSGCVMMVRREVFEQAGRFDEDYFFSFEDLDFCLRARRHGFFAVCVGTASAYHLGSRSIGAGSPRRIYFAARNHLLLARRRAPLPPPAQALRAVWIVALNLAHVLRGSGVARGAGIRAVWRGTLDHLRGRYGEPGAYGPG